MGEKRWLASEKIAFRILEERGYHILETHKRIRLGGIEVAEVDAIAKDSEGRLYVVEVKAGRLDVTGVRQAYSNAVILGAIPLVVCKGYADEAARQLAEKLGVKVIELEDVFLTDPEELETVIETAIEETVSQILHLLLDPQVRVKPEYYEVLRAIAEEPTIHDAAKRLNTTVQGLARRLEELRRQGLIPRRIKRYNSLRLVARLLIYRARLESFMAQLETNIERLEKLLARLGA